MKTSFRLLLLLAVTPLALGAENVAIAGDTIYTMAGATLRNGVVLLRDGSATTANSDYVAKASILLTIPAGQTSKVFSVNVKGDTAVEPDEAFNVTLSEVTGATVADGQATGTIRNDDSGGSTPSLSIGDVSVSEGNSGTKLATFTVQLSQAAAGNVTYSIATANGSATTANNDYVASSLSGQVITAGQTSKTFSVTINGDTAVESDETYTVTVSGVTGATIADGQATGTISNDDASATPTLSIGDVSISEGNSGTKLATFTVQLSQAAAGNVSYNIATADGSATTANNDYVASSLSGQVITAGQTSKTFSVTINGDAAVEPDENFTVNVSGVSGATVADGQATGTISNDDSSGGVPTLSIADVTVTEGNSGTKLATFTVQLSAPAPANVSYNITTANGTATTNNNDYVASTLNGQVIPAGQSSKTFSVTVNGDTALEGNERFRVNVSAVSGATATDTLAFGNIDNDD